MTAPEFPIPPFGDEPFDDEDISLYFDVMAAGPNAELRHDGTADPDAARAVEQAAVVASWQIDDDEHAERAARRLAAAQRVVEEKARLRDWWVSQIYEWYAAETRSAARTVSYFEERLQDYALRERVEHGRATIKLPSAEFGTTASNSKVEVVDDEQVVDYISSLPDDGDRTLLTWLNDPENVKRSVKVYVGPFRKFVRVERRPVGYRAHVVYACGHGGIYDVLGLDDKDVPAIGEVRECHVCDPDPIDGPPRYGITEVVVEEMFEDVVVGPDGEPVPGTQVDPGGITAKPVKVR